MAGTRQSAGGGAAGKLARLQVLAQEPEEQITFALSLLAAEANASVLQAALEVLEQHYEDAPPPTLRPPLLSAYARLEAGEGDDQGCYARAAILRMLRPLALPADAPLIERAAATYEFLPPGRSEVGAGLRAAALIALDEANPTLAGYHATRLLIDQHTSTMSGEPAVTAARVLAARGTILPLYAFLLRAEPGIPDVVAECLRNLAPIPPSVLAPLVDQYLTSEDEVVLLGLFDLLLAHETRDNYVETMLDFLRATRLYNLYRYLVSAIVAGRFKTLIAGLTAMAPTERDPRKSEILREALALR